MTIGERAAVAVTDGVVWQPSFGALPGPQGTRFRVWAPRATTLTLLVRAEDRVVHYSPVKTDDGMWEAVVADALPGTRYAYSIDGAEPRPDPASRFQPEGVHGWSEVVDPLRFHWSDSGWKGIDPGRVALYELHVGTFSGAGTFDSVAERLDYLRDLGVTAIELMPLADFPGTRNWGYDGVALFAPSRTYGAPDDLRRLVDRAHAAGLAVIVDVVYNHLGPEGAYLPLFSPEFLTDAHTTPWGNAVNLDRDGSRIVRTFLIENALHWIHEYHADGLRLDATHALVDETGTFVRDLTAAVHRSGGLVFAEDHRNLASMVADPAREGWGLDGLWADDFHHVVRRMLGGGSHGYYVDYEGTADELAATLRQGWLFVGQHSTHHGASRGTVPSDVAMRKAVICVQNHDQIGNRALGDRLHHAVSAAEWRAAVTVLLTAPMTPLLFMGQEWAARSPFQFFTDFEPSLGAKVVEGRRREFRAFPEFATAEGAERVPDPQSASTFDVSRLRWDEQSLPDQRASLALHRALLRLRAAHPALQASDATGCAATALDDGTVLFERAATDAGEQTFVVCARLKGSGTVAIDIDAPDWDAIITTEDAAYAADPQPIGIDRDARTLTFSRPGALILAVGAADRR